LKNFCSNGPDPAQKRTGPKSAQNKLGPGFYRAGLSLTAWAGLGFQPKTNMDWLLCICTVTSELYFTNCEMQGNGACTATWGANLVAETVIEDDGNGVRSRWCWWWPTGGGLDGGRWLWKPGTAVVFSSPLQRRCSFSWFPLFPLSTLFFPLYSSFMEVQVVGNG